MDSLLIGGADLCTPNPCKHGSCSTDSDTASGFICQCLPGWTGDLCDKGKSCFSVENEKIVNVSIKWSI